MSKSSGETSGGMATDLAGFEFVASSTEFSVMSGRPGSILQRHYSAGVLE
jgi:hypothetical protein